MKILRTPDERFAELPDFPFAPHYTEVTGLRMHYVDEGPPAADPMLLLHGEPSWSFLYRHMIPILASEAESGTASRVIAPDLIGFGRSDKPAEKSDYTYARHVAWMEGFIDALDLRQITLVCQDWGGLIGLRVVAAHPDRFARVVAANTFLPSGREPFSDAFLAWRKFSQEAKGFDIGRIVERGCRTELSAEVVAAYDAPFPDDSYKAGARIFPSLVPITPDEPAAADNQRAWATLATFDKPFLTAFADGDPITRGGDRVLRAAIPGARGQAHTTIEGAGHFLQEDRGPALARVVRDFVSST